MLQGTGSAGATVRMYIEQFEPDASKHEMDAQTALKPLIGEFGIYFCKKHVISLNFELHKIEAHFFNGNVFVIYML